MARINSRALEVAKRRTEVTRLYLQGRTQWDIAALVGVDQGTVSRDLKALQAEWRAGTVRDLDAEKGKELARIDNLERVYWSAWERSCQDAETSTQEKVTGGEAERLKASIRKEGQTGNASYLAGVQWCISKRCAILGLDAPQQVSLHARDVDREIARLLADLGHQGTAAPAAGAPAAGAGDANPQDGA